MCAGRTIPCKAKRGGGVRVQIEAAARMVSHYFKKRTAAMCYGTFRKQGRYIGSGPVEAACRTDVVARCKQSGMHWRFHNAIRICAIRAALRSGTFAP